MPDAPEPLPTQPSWRRAHTLAAVAIVAVAAAVRWPALAGELWLDEIWSLTQFALRPDSMRDVLWSAACNHDNNHRLNTIWLALMGRDAGPIAHRALAFACGVGLVAVVIALGRRFGRQAGLSCGALFAASFTLVVYGTEARGYAPMLLCAFAGFLVLDGELARLRASGRVGELQSGLFWLCTVLGILSHLTFLHFYLGALLWSAVQVCRAGHGRAAAAKALATLHLVPMVFVGFVWFWLLRRMERGGGPDWNLADLVDGALSQLLGYPTGVVPALPVATALAVALAFELRRMRRERDGRWLLFAGVIVLAPAATVALGPTDLMFGRYFLVPQAFFLFVVGRALARLRAMPAVLAVTLFVGGNAVAHLVPFLRAGRSHVREVAAVLRAATPGDGRVRITGWPMDLWVAMPLAWYGGRDGRPIDYVPYDSLERAADVDWLALLSQEPNAAAGEPTVQRWGGAFELVQTLPCYGPSGMHWRLYRRR